MKEESLAEQDLVSFSQNTHYISEWKEINFKLHSSRRHLPQPSPEEPQRRGTLKKEPSQKLDLRKWEEKMQNINKIEYPIIEERNLFQQEEDIILPKLKITPKPEPLTPPLRAKDQFSQRVRSIIEDSLIQKKLQKFKKELQQQRQEVEKKEGGFRAASLPRNLMLRKHGRNNWSQEISKWKNKPEKQLRELKRQLQFQSKRYSVPNLMKARLVNQQDHYDVNIH